MSTTHSSKRAGNGPDEAPPQDVPEIPETTEPEALRPEAAADELAAAAAADLSDDDPGGPDLGDPEAAGQPRPAAEPKSKMPLELQDRIDELNGQLLRALAEIDNVRKRGDRMVADAHKYAIANFAKDLLSVPDNLRRAMEAVPEEARTGDGLVAKLLEGVSAVDRELALAFEKHGLEKLEPLDVPFDPNFHEAVFEVPNSGKPARTVVQLLQTGYVLQGRLLRAAMVGVAKGDGNPPEHQVDTTA